MWVCINNISCSNLRKQISHFSPFILSPFLEECFIIKVYLENAADAKTLKSTLFTCLLVCTFESIAFQFITDVLSDFPYVRGKYLITGILKHHFITKFTKRKESNDGHLHSTDQISDKHLTNTLSNMKISDSSGKGIATTPTNHKEEGKKKQQKIIWLLI